MNRINEFLLKNDLRIATNPCISPDFCLEWEALKEDLIRGNALVEYPQSEFDTRFGTISVIENKLGDHAWRLAPLEGVDLADAMDHGAVIDGSFYYPATFENLVRIKNLAQNFDPNCTIFPTAAGSLASSTLGIGARFTTLHWPGVDWAMAHLGIGLTANQNSVPRELVYDVDAMLSEELDTVPFPFIGADVPEGHQGQSIEGMSHGCVLAKLKTGFHKLGIAWSFNADHQPIGGKYDARESKLVSGCVFASYITFDLSPELAITRVPDSGEACRAYVASNVDGSIVEHIAERVKNAGVDIDRGTLDRLLCYVWPAMRKMKIRDQKYQEIRALSFAADYGRAYLRELSIDELPGLTEPETTAVMLALCEHLEMPVDFVAPAFGFQKNMPYPDNGELKELIEAQWNVCKAFGISIGFHSGSGKSAENYRVMGEVTGRNLEIKTSGRYTYEMGVALSLSSDEKDQKLWHDWYAFTRELATQGAFSEVDSERAMAREFIEAALAFEAKEQNVFGSIEDCRRALLALDPSPEHMFWFEYNFLFVLVADGLPEKSALGSHSPAGYRQRSRFYSISEEGRLEFARRIARYIVFLAENTGLVSEEACAEALSKLAKYSTFSAFLSDIATGVCAKP